jgi:hypothetical protein
MAKTEPITKTCKFCRHWDGLMDDRSQMFATTTGFELVQVVTLGNFGCNQWAGKPDVVQDGDPGDETN